MKAVVLMFDTLTRHHLSTYGGDAITPNFERLAKKTVQFDKFFVGSMPCMPARRDMHTGRYNFLHRSWGPIEPFDFSMPEYLAKNKIHTHLVTDHKHYWRDGGATYHTRYTTFEFIRGQEGDAWKGHVEKPEVVYDAEGQEQQVVVERRKRRIAQDMINREYMKTELEHTLSRTIEEGLSFIRTNLDQDNWFLQLECFDPHEPFFVPEKYLQMYGCTQSDFNGWMYYNANTDSAEKQQLIQKFYKALLTMCDDYLGKVLDMFDDHQLWDDTMLMVCTDHGFLLGEHDWWGKNIMPLYEEVAHTPFFYWDPRLKLKDVKTDFLGQLIDIPATLLDFFGHDVPPHMHGRSFYSALRDNQPIRSHALYGYYGAHLNITDGQYVYMRSPKERHNSQYEYTLMPTAIDSRFTQAQLKGATLCDGFAFTNETPVLRIPTSVNYTNSYRFGDKLFDIDADPEQIHPLDNDELALSLLEKIKALLIENEAPDELYQRYALEDLTLQNIRQEKIQFEQYQLSAYQNYNLSHHCVAEGLEVLGHISDNPAQDKQNLLAHIDDNEQITPERVYELARILYQDELLKKAIYQLNLAMRYD
ncbi:sulfatase [Vibrio gazogenes]|uniref:Sulfatase n=1 Tax=Vibrio gazogenes TaxID=687 RepID=A0A1Z2SDW6_VIBGA|nr:sulfatase [Vibrio gazogenes]ASA55338.1 sulfatase [Vibrio gazogenes]